ncbi:PqqD family peptide modification chaperone [Desulfocicer niacini]
MDKFVEKPCKNEDVVFREEEDNWGILFHPDQAKVYALNPVSAYIWKHLDGEHSVPDIEDKLKAVCNDIPENPTQFISAFIEDLWEIGYLAE